MTFQDLLDYFGTVAAIARALGAPHQTVSDWRESGIPLGRQYQIQIATQARLKADAPALRKRTRRRPVEPLRPPGVPDDKEGVSP